MKKVISCIIYVYIKKDQKLRNQLKKIFIQTSVKPYHNSNIVVPRSPFIFSKSKIKFIQKKSKVLIYVTPNFDSIKKIDLFIKKLLSNFFYKYKTIDIKIQNRVTFIKNNKTFVVE